MAQDQDTKEVQNHAGPSEESLANTQQVASEMAKAFQELARGEQTASALERQLDGIESRIDQLLAEAEAAAEKQNRQTNGQDTEPK